MKALSTIRLAAILGLGLGVLLSPAVSRASLIGDTVSCSINNASSLDCNHNTAVVGSGVEFFVGFFNSDYFKIDFGANDVLITGLQTASFQTTIITLADLTHHFLTETLLSTSNVSGISSSDIGLDTHGNLTIDLRGSTVHNGGTIDIGFGGSTTSVPEPATIALFGAGLFGLAYVGRRRSSKAV